MEPSSRRPTLRPPYFRYEGRKRHVFRKTTGGPFYLRWTHNGKTATRCLKTPFVAVAICRARLLLQADYAGVETAMRALLRFHGRPLPAEIATATRIPLVGTAGIYFLLSSGKVQYVGQSINVLGRLGEHVFRKAGHFDEIAYIEIPHEQLNAEERRYIEIFQPPLNRGRGGGVWRGGPINA